MIRNFTSPLIIRSRNSAGSRWRHTPRTRWAQLRTNTAPSAVRLAHLIVRCRIERYEDGPRTGSACRLPACGGDAVMGGWRRLYTGVVLVHSLTRKPAWLSRKKKPSNGLEPLTPSLPMERGRSTEFVPIPSIGSTAPLLSAEYERQARSLAARRRDFYARWTQEPRVSHHHRCRRGPPALEDIIALVPSRHRRGAPLNAHVLDCRARTR
jgi:hypothetical protein